MMVTGEIATCGAEGARTLSNSQAKGTVTGLYSGEHAFKGRHRWGSLCRQNSQVQQTETKVDSSAFVSVFIFKQKSERRGEGV